MHIAFLASDLASRSAGGIGTYVETVATGLALRGHQVTVVSPRLSHHVEVPYDTQLLDASVSYAMRRPELAEAFVTAVKQLHSTAPIDVIEATDYGLEGLRTVADPDLRRADVPTVVRLHTPDSIVCELNSEIRLADSRAVHEREGDYFRAAKHLTAPSFAMAREVERRWGVPASAVTVLPNPISRLESRHRAESKGTCKRVVFFGRLERRKGAHVMAHAMRLLLPENPDVSVEFIGADTRTGGGSMGQVLRAALAPWARQVTFAGHLAGERRRAALQGADVVCLPSLWENFPYACLEALALGRPVVATAGSGFDEIVEPGTDGILVPPNDEVALARGIIEVLSDPVGYRPRDALVAELDVRKLVPKFEEYYAGVAA